MLFRTVARSFPKPVVVRPFASSLTSINSSFDFKSLVGSSLNTPSSFHQLLATDLTIHHRFIAPGNLVDVSYEEPATDAVEMELHGGVRRSVIKKKRTHGFLQRMASTGGRRVLRLRRNKGRKFLTV